MNQDCLYCSAGQQECPVHPPQRCEAVHPATSTLPPADRVRCQGTEQHAEQHGAQVSGARSPNDPLGRSGEEVWTW